MSNTGNLFDYGMETDRLVCVAAAVMSIHTQSRLRMPQSCRMRIVMTVSPSKAVDCLDQNRRSSFFNVLFSLPLQALDTLQETGVLQQTLRQTTRHAIPAAVVVTAFALIVPDAIYLKAYCFHYCPFTYTQFFMSHYSPFVSRLATSWSVLGDWELCIRCLVSLHVAD